MALMVPGSWRRLAAKRTAPIVTAMNDAPEKPLRRGWTTGACATAAVKAALMRLWGGAFPDAVTITLPRGEAPSFAIAHRAAGADWAEAGVVKDAGDDPDVTHGALIVARVAEEGSGLRFRAGAGVGTVTRAGLPVPPGEPAINPVPRAMMAGVVVELAARHGKLPMSTREFRISGKPENRFREYGDLPLTPGIGITLTIPGGEALALKTWNPRLGITGGLSVLGTTGIVRPFSCAAWIASIHRGVDVARAAGLTHVAGTTGATSERAVQALYDLPDHAMLDMGDFAGGMLKYLARHPVERVTVGGGLAKIAKLAQGARDLHSRRSQVDLGGLADWTGDDRLREANTVLEAHAIMGDRLAGVVAQKALLEVRLALGSAPIRPDVVIVNREGAVIARAGL